MSCLDHWPFLNRRNTIHVQLIAGNIYGVGFAVVATLCVCLILIYGLAASSNASARSSLTQQAQTEILSNAKEIASVINQTLQIVSQSMSMVESLQAKILLKNSDIATGGIPTLRFPYYREYNFHAACTLCPPDYGPLAGRSRITTLSGSVQHSSVYLYDSATASSIRTDPAFDAHLNQSLPLKIALEALAILDNDFRIHYTEGPPLTAIFYSAVQVRDVFSSNYLAIRKTFPGIPIEDVTYNPAARSWFANAPDGYVYINGPYVETFTRQLAFTISSKNLQTLGTTEFTVVGASVIFLKDLTKIVQQTTYMASGFAALIRKSTLEVLAYGNETTFDDVTGSFKLIGELDPDLAGYTGALTSGQPGVISYSRSTDNGAVWYCSYVPLFPSSSNAAPDPSYTFVILYFAKESEVLTTIPALAQKITQTTNLVTIGIVVGCALVFIISVVIIGCYVQVISAPLTTLKAASRSIIFQATEEVRDYSQLIQDIVIPSTQNEIAVLVSYMKMMVIKLNDLETVKRNKPKYPPNQYHNFVYKPWLGKVEVEDTKEVSRSSDSEKFDFPPPKKTVEPAIPKDEEVIQIEPAATVEEVKASTCCTLKFHIYLINIFVILAFCAVMVACVVTLNKDSQGWLDETGVLVRNSVVDSIDLISTIKSSYLSLWFQQSTLDGYVLNKFYTDLNNGDIYNGLFNLPSYALDVTNVYVSSTSPSTDYSGYYLPASAHCNGYFECNQWQNSGETTISSLLDLKFMAFNYRDSVLSFIQTATSSDGYTRLWPYTRKSYASQSTCGIDNATLPECKVNQQICDSGSIPSYDPRCRSWYNLGYPTAGSNLVYFDKPRLSSGGTLVVTAVSASSSPNGTLYGVMSQNILASTMTSAVNSLKILSNGYAYVIYSHTPELLVLHPQQRINCDTLNCSEPFTLAEYAKFKTDYLDVIATGKEVSGNYMKAGEQWTLASSNIRYGTVAYTLILTVPETDITATVVSIQNSIGTTIIGMIIGFAVLVVLTAMLIMKISQVMTTRIIEPLHDLTNICKEVIKNNLEREIPQKSSSVDMKAMLEAFGGMIITLRFGSDSYAKGDLKKAKKAFEDALQLFEGIANRRGIGIAHNNLAAVYLAEQNFKQSEDHYQQSIQNARDILKDTADETEQTKWKKVLSDRLGNYALFLVETKKFPEAFQTLNEGFDIDTDIGNTHGWVIKQGILGLFYLAQGENKDSLKSFKNTLKFVEKSFEDTEGKWKRDDLPIAHQIALYNLGNYYSQTNELEEAEKYLLESVSLPSNVDQSTFKRTLISLNNLYKKLNKEDESRAILSFMKELGFEAGTVSSNKRIVFALDYSGSMSGMKINSAVDSIISILTDHVKDNDEFMMMHFNAKVFTDVPMTAKKDGFEYNRTKINGLRGPSGGTAMFDAIVEARAVLSRTPKTEHSQWIVVLTDGDDNNSHNKPASVMATLKTTSEDVVKGLLIIGVGSDVKTDVLKELVKTTKEGSYIHADSDSKSISQAFAKVAQLIQGHIVLEDF